ncbi:hypothetical protein [Streptomyces sp. NPDC059787]|uniref:hypothetical protein n=1 Tax=Streptomyces sp. NPDC059787 TaxID=3346947 RepID=UPI00365F752A
MQLAPSALHATAETLTTHLGTNFWQINELILDDIVSLDGPHDRQLSLRTLGNGSIIQMWATGGAQPDDPQTFEGFPPLINGRRWHTWIHIGDLEADQDPATVLHTTIVERLLPVFEAKPLYVGHRPWDPEPETEAEPEATAQTETEQPEPAPAPEPKTPADPAPAPAAQAPDNVVPMKARRKPAASKPTTPAADAEPKSRTTRKRTPAKPAASKPTTPAADAEPKSRTTRKRTPTKPAASKPAT